MLTERPTPINYPLPEKPMTIDEYAQLMNWFISSVYFLVKNNPGEFQFTDFSQFKGANEIRKNFDTFDSALEKQSQGEPFHLVDYVHYNPIQLTGKYVYAKIDVAMRSQNLYNNVVVAANTRHKMRGNLGVTYPTKPFAELSEEQQNDPFMQKFYSSIAGTQDTGTVGLTYTGEYIPGQVWSNLHNLNSLSAQYFFSFVTLLNDEINKVIKDENK